MIGCASTKGLPSAHSGCIGGKRSTCHRSCSRRRTGRKLYPVRTMATSVARSRKQADGNQVQFVGKMNFEQVLLQIKQQTSLTACFAAEYHPLSV